MAEVKHVEMIHEMANLLNEWEATVASARTDWRQQQTKLQQALQQAETVIGELRALVAQAEQQKCEELKPQQPVTGSVTHPDTWAEAITAFGLQLQADGYSQSTITRILSHVQKFTGWLAEPAYIELPLRPPEPVEPEINHEPVIAADGTETSSSTSKLPVRVSALNKWESMSLLITSRISILSAISRGWSRAFRRGTG